MFLLVDTYENILRFEIKEELREYIELRHAKEGGFDWVSEIKDEIGNMYGCSWSLEIELIG